MDSGQPDSLGPTERDIVALQRPLHELPDPLPIPALLPNTVPFDACIRPPGSKSLTNRALLLAALADGVSTLRGPLLGADDAERMIAALSLLGARFERRGDLLRVSGVGGRWRPVGAEVHLDLGNAGTATRFLAAAALLSPVPVVIDGNARMRQRPIGELGAALTALGARIEYGGATGYPPLRIFAANAARGMAPGTTVSFDSLPSSQFVSALVLAGPWLGGLDLSLPPEVTSRSYVEMTVGLMRRLGARIHASADWRHLRVTAGGIGPFDYEVEPDASGATYFWGAAALIPGARVRVPGLDDGSLQGDAHFPSLLARMGAPIASGQGGIEVAGPRVLSPIEADLSDMPDTAMTLAAVAAFASGPSVLRGLRTLRVKETDRIDAMRTELGRIGVGVDSGFGGDDGAIRIVPTSFGEDHAARGVDFDTYDDHRMAMSLTLIGLRRPGVRVKNPRCVAKTYPGFWSDLAAMLGSRPQPGTANSAQEVLG